MIKNYLALVAVAGAAVAMAPAAHAEKSYSAGCGVGAMAFQGQSGTVPHVLAATTNGFFGNQTFGMTFGSLGCDTSGEIAVPAEVKLVTGSRFDAILAETAQGGGETLVALATLMGVEEQDRPRLFNTMQANFTTLAPSADVTSEQFIVALYGVMKNDEVLSKYVAA